MPKTESELREDVRAALTAYSECLYKKLYDSPIGSMERTSAVISSAQVHSAARVLWMEV